MRNAVRQLIYRSTATRPIDAEELRAIKAGAAAFNEDVGVTGFLLYCSGHFVQVIEGDAEAITTVLRRIAADARHTDVRVLGDWHDVDRCFPAWSMGAALIDEHVDQSSLHEEGLKTVLRDRLADGGLPDAMRQRVLDDIDALRTLAA